MLQERNKNIAVKKVANVLVMLGILKGSLELRGGSSYVPPLFRYYFWYDCIIKSWGEKKDKCILDERPWEGNHAGRCLFEDVIQELLHSAIRTLQSLHSDLFRSA